MNFWYNLNIWSVEHTYLFLLRRQRKQRMISSVVDTTIPPTIPINKCLSILRSPGHRCCPWSVPMDCLSLCAHQQNVKYLIIACFRQNVKHFLYLWKLKLRAWIKNSLSTITRILCVCVELKDCVVHWLFRKVFLEKTGKYSGSVCWVPCFEIVWPMLTSNVPLKILALKKVKTIMNDLKEEEPTMK